VCRGGRSLDPTPEGERTGELLMGKKGYMGGHNDTLENENICH